MLTRVMSILAIICLSNYVYAQEEPPKKKG